MAMDPVGEMQPGEGRFDDAGQLVPQILGPQPEFAFPPLPDELPPQGGGFLPPSGVNSIRTPGEVGPASAMAEGQLGDFEHPLRQLCATWVEKLRIAQRHKETKFSEDAEECMRFFCGPYDFLYSKRGDGGAFSFKGDPDEPGDEMPALTFEMTVNKVAEAVQIFGPVLYHRNPTRKVNPREVPQIPVDVWPSVMGDLTDPFMVQSLQQAAAESDRLRLLDRVRATLIEFYLNWTPVELKLKDHSRRAIDEAIIKGMGCLWTELYEPPGLPDRPEGGRYKMVGTFQDSVDHLLIDPDCETLDDATWIARRCVHPVWQVEREYGLAPGSLRGYCESTHAAGELNASEDGPYRREQGGTNDLVSYWKVYSKMGVGGRLQGVPEALGGVLDQFGDYCFLVVVENCPYPLNLPPDLIASADPAAPDMILQRLDWPTPFWADDDWPMTPIAFHHVPRQAWPMSHFKPAMGELCFLNWVYSFLAGRIRNSCRDFIGIAESAGDDLAEQILHGKDLTLLKIKQLHGKTIAEVVSFLQHPQINGDVWKVIEAVTANFEKRTGLSELVYGESSRQMRSASEADLKGAQLQIRPDDMAQVVEEAMSVVARKEAIALRYHLKGPDVAVVMGPVNAHLWDLHVSTEDLFELSKQLEYRIEAGSSKKPNKDRDAANMNSAVQTLFQPLFTYAQATGNTNPVNALIRDWGKSIDLAADEYMLVAPPPPEQVPEGAAGGPGGQQSQEPQGPEGGAAQAA